MPFPVGIIADEYNIPASGGDWTPAELPNIIGWFDTASYGGGSTWDNLVGIVDLVRDNSNIAIRNVNGKNMVCTYATGSVPASVWNWSFGILSQPFTVVVVEFCSSLTLENTGFDIYKGITGGDIQVYHWSNTSTFNGYTAFASSTVDTRNDMSNIIGCLHNGMGNSWIDIDGAKVIGNNNPADTTDLRFGQSTWSGWNTGSPTTQAFGEIVIVDDLISDTNLTALYSYLRDKWWVDLPLTIAGLKLWLDATNPATITQSSNAVSQWRSRDPANRGATAPGASKPTTNTRTIGGKNALAFVAANSSYIGGDGSLVMSAPATHFCVLKADSVSSTLRETGFGAYSGPDASIYQSAANKWGLRGPSPTESTTVVDLNPHVLSAVFASSGNSQLWLDGVSILTANIGAAGRSLWYFVGSGNGSLYFDGLIGEVIVYDTVLSDVDRIKIENYLKAKWGTP